ncbi:MAG: iron ABC transporter permease [Betaproteobacteria bacterium]|nr:iron ABC transporter permease [Betaproteobacteria bacterium]
MLRAEPPLVGSRRAKPAQARLAPAVLPLASSTRWAPLARRLGIVMLGLAVTLLWGYPLLGFLLGAILPHVLQGSVAFSLQAFALALRGGMLGALRNSALVSLGAALLALPMGAWLAWLRTRTALAWTAWIEAGVWLLLVMPGYFLASGWMLLAAPIGPLTADPAALHFAQGLLGPAGIVLTLALKALPFVFLAVQASFLNTPAGPLEAARVLGLSRRRRLGLAAVMLVPALVAGFTAAFAESASDFAVAATLGAGSGFTLATYAIEQAVNAMPLNFPLAAASSWLLVALLLPALILQGLAGRGAAARRSLGAKHRPAAPARLRPSTAVLHAIAAALLAWLALGIPLFAAVDLALGGTGPADIGAELSTVLPAFGYSMELAVLAASVTVLLAWPIAALTATNSRGARLLDLAMLGVMALPGIVLAASYVQTYNQPWTPLYGGSTLLAMAYVALALPASSRVLLAPVAQLHRSLSDAGRVHGLSRLQTLLAIDLPLLARPLFAAWLLAALHIAFELPASELLYPAGHPPLAVALLDAANGFQLHQQARVQLLGMGLLMGFAAVARLGFGRLAARRAAPRLAFHPDATTP